MKKVTYTVICPFDKSHKFPATYEIEDEATGVPSAIEEYCPFCDKYVRVQIDQRLRPDQEVLRRFGFSDSAND